MPIMADKGPVIQLGYVLDMWSSERALPRGWVCGLMS